MSDTKTIIIEDKLEQALNWIISIFMKRSINYQISGGFAAHIYGAKRPVNDIDFDVPEDSFDDIYEDIKDYIVWGPGQFCDERWDLKMITLNYKGQEIDIGGAYKVKICNVKTGRWINLPSNLSTARIFNINRLMVRVCDPYDLIEYKKLLKGQHQKDDIKSVEDYLKNE